MSNRIKSLLKALSVLIVLIAVLIQLDYISIPYIDYIRFWIVVGGFGLFVISSR